MCAKIVHDLNDDANYVWVKMMKNEFSKKVSHLLEKI